MLLLVFFLVSCVVGQIHKETVDNYNVVIKKGVLKSVIPGEKSPDTLDLSNLCIRKIDPNCFEEVKGLKNLTLRLNVEDDTYSQGNLPPLVFRFLSDLETLKVLKSDLRELQYVFWGLSNLRLLDLKGSTITLEEGSLFGLSNETEILMDNRNRLKIEPVHFLEPFPFMSLCVINGIVQSLELINNTANTSGDCDLKYLPLRSEMVALDSMGIKGFAKDWYRIVGKPVHVLTLMRNDIEHLERNLFNDLPNDLYEIYLSWNKIKRVERGRIANLNLRTLDLGGNPIFTVDTYAFRDTNLTKLVLTFEFMKTLPKSLIYLDFFSFPGNYAINSV